MYKNKSSTKFAEIHSVETTTITTTSHLGKAKSQSVTGTDFKKETKRSRER